MWTSPEGEAEWFRLVPATLMYDETYNATYCQPCYESMKMGVYDWADEEYMSRLALYTHQRFKDMINARHKKKRGKGKITFSMWTCGCCEKKFLGH